MQNSLTFFFHVSYAIYITIFINKEKKKTFSITCFSQTENLKLMEVKLNRKMLGSKDLGFMYLES